MDKEHDEINDLLTLYHGGRKHVRAMDSSEHAKGGKVHSDAAFIGYLSPHGKFESYPESVAKENDYHHSNTIKDLDAYNQEGGLTFVRYGSEPVVTIKGEPAMDPHHPKHSPMISDLARRLVASGAHPSMPLKVDNMGFKQHEAPYQGKHIGTIEEWTQRNKKAKGGSVGGITPEQMHELQQHVLASKGQYGAKRLQRAFDEIPHLGHMFDLDALKEAFHGDNAKALATIDPKDFENYAHGLSQRNDVDIYPDIKKRIKAKKIDKWDLNTPEYIKYLASIGKFDQVPYLQLHKEESGLPLMPEITGHEGRHRNRALASQGKDKSLISIFPAGDLREPLPRGSQEEYINALKKEMAMTDNMVRPEYRPQVKDEGERRSPILLPDLYAEGGEARSSFKKQIEQMRGQADMRQKLQNEYIKSHAHLPTNQWPTMQDWLNKRQGN